MNNVFTAIQNRDGEALSRMSGYEHQYTNNDNVVNMSAERLVDALFKQLKQLFPAAVVTNLKTPEQEVAAKQQWIAAFAEGGIRTREQVSAGMRHARASESPFSVVMRHWSRAMGMPSAGGRAAYIATFIASTTILGALSQQLNDLASGRNPREMTGEDAAKFWLGALLKGGGLGLYGDFLLSDHTRYGSGALASMLGPVAGLVDDVVKIAQGIPLNAVEGKSEQTGGDLVKLGKGLMPGANLWYLKAALDHMIFNQMQEYFSPGYLRKMEQRSKKEFNQTYWWRPQDVTPQ